MFEAPSGFYELDGAPVEERGELWRRVLAVEVGDVFDEGFAEVARPEVIHGDARGEGVLAVGNPVGQGGAASGAGAGKTAGSTASVSVGPSKALREVRSEV